MEKEQFMNAVYSKDKELNTFLKNNFFVSENNTENDTILSDVGGNIDSLKELSELEKKIAKARLIQLEESNDVSKFFPSLVAIVAALLLAINIISGWVIGAANLEATNLEATNEKEKTETEEVKAEKTKKEETEKEEESSSNSEIFLKTQNTLFVLSIAVILAIGLIIWYTFKLTSLDSHRRIAIYINALLEESLNNKKQELEPSLEVNNNESKNPQLLISLSKTIYKK